MIQKDLEDPRGWVPRISGALKGAAAFLLLLTTILVVNCLQTASLVLRPFSKKAFRGFNRACAQAWWGFCVFGSEHWYRIQPVFSGDEVPNGENAFVIANHQQMPDILALMMFGWRKKRLGDMKFFVKDVLKYTPGVGWGMLFLDCVFLKRNWERDEALIQRTFGRFLKERIPVWLVSFPEGTRLTLQKAQRSREYAREKALPVFDNVLVPRTKGFVAAVGGLRRHLTAIYDVTIAYPDGIPTLWQYLKGLVHEIHLHVRRYPMTEIPVDSRKLSEWLLARFEEKNRFLTDFYSGVALRSADSAK